MFPTLGARLRGAISNRLCVVALVGGIATLAGCSTSGAMRDRGPSTPRFGGLVVRNNNFNSMTVFLVQGGVRVRLGEVNGLSQEVFPSTRLGLGAGGPGTFLVARPLAGRAFRSEPLLFAPGRMLVWTIENQPAFSYLSVR